MPPLRRWRPLVLVVAIWLLTMYYWFGVDDDPTSIHSIPANRPQSGHHGPPPIDDSPPENGGELNAKRWRKLPDRFPVTELRSLPEVKPGNNKIPRIQAYPPPTESTSSRRVRLQRQKAVKDSFLHSWNGYKKHAWMSDEVKPLSGQPKNPFGGWAATLVDALDSLWILGLTEEFEKAVAAAETIDFSKTEMNTINIFETTIRYLGGFLAAYELSGKNHPGLLRKATEVGELVMCAFDTSNRMPIARWQWKEYMTGHVQKHDKGVLVSELGSLSLELTKLSQLTGDMKYYDAVQRISDEFEKGQDKTNLPGMWPISVDPRGPSFTTDNSFTLGGMADSLYEYLPKQYLLLGGVLDQPRKMYEKFIVAAKKSLMRRALNSDNIPLVISGDAKVKVMDGGKHEVVHVPKAQHLTCFTGGMVGIASKIFDRADDMDLAQQLTEGCVWAYNATASGIMPEIFKFAVCGAVEDSQTGPKCKYEKVKWLTAVRDLYSGPKSGQDAEGEEIASLVKGRKLSPGFVELNDRRYILRPEAIESVFIMYRLTGDPLWQEKAWMMFESIEKHTSSDIGAASLQDVTVAEPTQVDSMESFWLAETLKYFYLVFAEFDLVDLDTWVLNTEAHPLHRPDVP